MAKPKRIIQVSLSKEQWDYFKKQFEGEIFSEVFRDALRKQYPDFPTDTGKVRWDYLDSNPSLKEKITRDADITSDEMLASSKRKS